MTIKKTIFLILVSFISLSVYSQGSGLGLGIIIGEPTGLSAKMWTSEKTAIDAGIAWSFVGSGYMRVHADMLVHNFSIDVDKGQLPIYFGLGAKLLLASDLGLGVRIPVGIAYLFESAPFDIFVEVVPGLDLLPGTDFGIDGAMGVRYFF